MELILIVPFSVHVRQLEADIKYYSDLEQYEKGGELYKELLEFKNAGKDKEHKVKTTSVNLDAKST